MSGDEWAKVRILPALEGLVPVACLSPGIAQPFPLAVTPLWGHSQSQAGFQGAAVLCCLLVKLQTAFPKQGEQ